ncbi:Hydroxyacylglutathione hydrolase, mitochondrial [Hondaea fermentalgiana]|uniref:hydroxyacylglutathione hydrolase n=1 Tax=Hondaea fermentalgiana TaxID=2315210 RepID=A0A2R5G512_9STRA|nr:Hydroxyacylglutathione hydrolase, mitochondrial [Hondaea fermentalgiana]|eukprot:GBG24878.1 Hydroxyacylglutathione hydrolase, mitochondrial [Hondaea fermentalgiana]
MHAARTMRSRGLCAQRARLRRNMHSIQQEVLPSWVSTRTTRVDETGLEVATFGARQDNYGFVVRGGGNGGGDTGETLAVDTPEWAPLLEALHGSKLDVLLTTHGHHDHVAGHEDAAKYFGSGLRIYGPEEETNHIPKLTDTVKPGDEIELAGETVRVINVSGHTLGHIAYYFTRSKVLFPGDSIFPLGCGRVFEGTFEDSYEALNRIKELPHETLIFAAHEYALSNAAFAVWADPNNADLAAHAEFLKAQVAAKEPTVPTTLGQELRFNPFLRAETLERFSELRKQKDNF